LANSAGVSWAEAVKIPASRIPVVRSRLFIKIKSVGSYISRIRSHVSRIRNKGIKIKCNRYKRSFYRRCLKHFQNIFYDCRR